MVLSSNYYNQRRKSTIPCSQSSTDVSRQIPTTCHVRFEEISSKRSFFQNPSKCKTHYSKGSIS
ncbi:unnamed protein product, partial [Vitis vinifera]